MCFSRRRLWVNHLVAGCALVSTKYKGVYEYAGDKYNALLVPIKDSIKLAESIICSRMMIKELS